MIPKSLNTKSFNAATFCFGITSLFWITSLILYATRESTPIADDYCFAQLSERGVFFGTYDQFVSWDGNYSLTFLTILIVGLPLIFFEVNLGSAVPIIFITLFLFVLFLYFSSKVLRTDIKKGIYQIAVAFIILCSWNVYWMSFKKSPSFVGIDFSSNFAMLTDGFLHWKTLQISYFLMFFLVIVFTIFAWNQICKANLSLLLIPIGFFLGGSSYILAGTSLFLIEFYLLSKGKNSFKRYFKNNVIFVSTTTIGVLLNFFSPGAQRRKDVLDLALAPTRSISNSLIQTLEYLLHSILNFGFLFMIVAGFSIAPLLAQQVNAKSYIKRIPVPYIFLSIFTTIGCYFAGSSPWRYSHLFILSWILGLLVGVYLYQFKLPFMMLANLTALTSIILTSIVFGSSLSAISLRHDAFVMGPSPISGIEDIESAWVNDCAIASGISRI